MATANAYRHHPDGAYWVAGDRSQWPGVVELFADNAFIHHVDWPRLSNLIEHMVDEDGGVKALVDSRVWALFVPGPAVDDGL